MPKEILNLKHLQDDPKLCNFLQRTDKRSKARKNGVYIGRLPYKIDENTEDWNRFFIIKNGSVILPNSTLEEVDKLIELTRPKNLPCLISLCGKLSQLNHVTISQINDYTIKVFWKELKIGYIKQTEDAGYNINNLVKTVNNLNLMAKTIDDYPEISIKAESFDDEELIKVSMELGLESYDLSLDDADEELLYWIDHIDTYRYYYQLANNGFAQQGVSYKLKVGLDTYNISANFNEQTYKQRKRSLDNLIHDIKEFKSLINKQVA